MSRGLFQRDKLIFATMMVIAIERLRGDLDENELQFLLRCPGAPSPSPVDFLTPTLWGNIKVSNGSVEKKNLSIFLTSAIVVMRTIA